MDICMEKINPLMFVGTGSDVGKSVIAAAFGRILWQDGYHPAPYKAQNMALNSFVTQEGGEMGRAQVVQAEACCVTCHTDMNPVLLKSSSDQKSQVILNGKTIGEFSARSYFSGEQRQWLFKEVMQAFDRLSARYNPIVIEGAGSISELNLKKNDIVNMRVAIQQKATVFLIADIDRGGVFGSLYGTMALLDEDERRQIKGIIINKFRGDISLFDDGRKIIEDLCGVPVLGVIPAFTDIHIEEEDSIAQSIQKQHIYMEGKVNVAVVLLRRMSNFTDFNRLEQDDRVNLFYTHNSKEIEEADIVVIPGTKSTIADLMELRKNGIAATISKVAQKGKMVIGICGGYQMMGDMIKDDDGVESDIREIKGLGIFPMTTTMCEEKRTAQMSFNFKGQYPCVGYEIHLGESVFDHHINALNVLSDGTNEGFMSGICWGTYMHGILDNTAVIEDLLSPYEVEKNQGFDYETYKQGEYDKLAAHVRQYITMDLFYHIVQSNKWAK